MNVRNLLAAVALLTAVAIPALGSAQRPLRIDPNHFKVDKNKGKVDKDHFKVDKNKAKVHPRQAQVHPRRLAVNQKDGRHQPRLLGRKDRHTVRKNVRGVTHHVTKPHHPVKKG